MWFAIGVITLISFSVYFGIQRHGARWKGQRAQAHAQPRHEYEFVRRKDKLKKMRVGLDAPRHFNFTLKRESSIDRFCKSLGLSVEHQIGHQAVDRLVYIVSNDQHLLDRCMEDPAMIELVQSLFNLQHLDSRITQVHCRHGRIWAEFQVSSLFNDKSNEERLSQIFPKAAAKLLSMARLLQAQAPSDQVDRRDPFIFRAALVLALSTGLLINGGVHAFRQMGFSEAFTVETAQLWTYTIFTAVAIVVALVGAALFLLGRTARTHLVLIEIVLVGSIGAVLTAFTEIRDLNMDLDRSAMQRYEAKVLGKDISTSRRRGTRYYVYVPEWTGSGWTSVQAVRRLRVSSSFYQSVQRGEQIVFRQHQGFLGIHWVAGFSRAESGASP